MRDADGGSRMGALPLAFGDAGVLSGSGRRGVAERDGVRECGRLREEESVALSTSALPAQIRRMRRVMNSAGSRLLICCLRVEVVAWVGFGIVRRRSGMDAEKRIVTSRGSAPESEGLRLSIKGLSRASYGSARSRLQLIFAKLEVIALPARSRGRTRVSRSQPWQDKEQKSALSSLSTKPIDAAFTSTY